MSLGPWQLIIIAIVILVLFGRGRISEMMGDFGKGIKSFKQGMNEDDAEEPSPRIEGPAASKSASDVTIDSGDSASSKTAAKPTDTSS
jgi:sec-independent protein translocase protein TatA